MANKPPPPAAYKLHEFVAHGADVNCLSIGKKSCTIFITGAQDHMVNLWPIGKPTSLLSLSGHTSSVQSVAFDSTEVLVLAGSSNGTIKLWDLEEAKLVRTITGHRLNCAAVEFHPFGEFFASGSLDTDLKIWDIRKKGCTHTYKGHTRGIRTIRFSPDGRWVVTGGDDHVVKIWDLTAGKLLHDFKFHNGTIRCIDFHPQEFLLATGSADRTVNFWDLETFELIGSAGPEATGVRSMVFHPDGRTLFCGLDETLKVFSWEPIRCHDSVGIGWSTLGDLCICEGKLLGCSYYQSRAGVWVADISLIGPYAVNARTNAPMDPINIYGEDHSAEIKRGCPTSGNASVDGPPDYVGKTIDIVGGSPVISNICSQSFLKEDRICSSEKTYLNSTAFRRGVAIIQQQQRSLTSCQNATAKLSSKFPSTVPPLNSSAFRVSKATEVTPGSRMESIFASKDTLSEPRKFHANSSLTPTNDTVLKLDTVSNTQTTSSLASTQVFVPRESRDSESVASSRNDTGITETKVPKQPVRQSSSSGDGRESRLVGTISMPTSSSADDLGSMDSSVTRGRARNTETVKNHESKSTCLTNFSKKFERARLLEQHAGLHIEKDLESPCSSSETSSVKYVRGVAIQLGRTRSLVERWEKREQCSSCTSTVSSSSSEQESKPDSLPPVLNGEAHVTPRDTKVNGEFGCEPLLQGHDVFINLVKSRLTKLQVVRHVWARNGIKDAIDAVLKLPDYSVQADVIGILMDKIGIFTLDIFSCLLPVLVGLLKSKTERHVTVSLELLFKLVKIFGPLVYSTISTSSMVGVNLQAEQRLERCKQCYNHLQKIRQSLPLLIRNGGLQAKHAQKLNVALNEW